MGWLIATILLPIVFMIVATYIVLKLALLVLRLIFAPVIFLTRR
jgi:hypothetical protein